MRHVVEPRHRSAERTPPWPRSEVTTGWVADEIEETVDMNETRAVFVHPQDRRSICSNRVYRGRQVPEKTRARGIALVESGRLL